MNRFRRKVDSNHRAITAAFRMLGASAHAIASDVKAGLPDLVVGYLGRTHLVEVKPDTELARHQPSEAQQKWAQAWKGGSVALVRNTTQVAALLVMWRDQHEKEFRAAKALAAVQP